MIRAVTPYVAALMVLSISATASAQHDHAAATKQKPAVMAFEHYEQVRAALSADRLADVAPHAKQLAGMIEPLAGGEAKKAADAVAAATTLEDARTHFGELSTILVPIFQAEAIPGAHAFQCEMKKKPWIQKGDKIQNPYYGKSMPTCGTPLPAKGK